MSMREQSVAAFEHDVYSVVHCQVADKSTLRDVLVLVHADGSVVITDPIDGETLAALPSSESALSAVPHPERPSWFWLAHSEGHGVSCFSIVERNGDWDMQLLLRMPVASQLADRSPPRAQSPLTDLPLAVTSLAVQRSATSEGPVVLVAAVDTDGELHYWRLDENEIPNGVGAVLDTKHTPCRWTITCLACVVDQNATAFLWCGCDEGTVLLYTVSLVVGSTSRSELRVEVAREGSREMGAALTFCVCSSFSSGPVAKRRSDRILCGFERGELCLFDAVTGQPVGRGQMDSAVPALCFIPSLAQVWSVSTNLTLCVWSVGATSLDRLFQQRIAGDVAGSVHSLCPVPELQRVFVGGSGADLVWWPMEVPSAKGEKVLTPQQGDDPDASPLPGLHPSPPILGSSGDATRSASGNNPNLVQSPPKQQRGGGDDDVASVGASSLSSTPNNLQQEQSEVHASPSIMRDEAELLSQHAASAQDEKEHLQRVISSLQSQIRNEKRQEARRTSRSPSQPGRVGSTQTTATLTDGQKEGELIQQLRNQIQEHEQQLEALKDTHDARRLDWSRERAALQEQLLKLSDDCRLWKTAAEDARKETSTLQGELHSMLEGKQNLASRQRDVLHENERLHSEVEYANQQLQELEQVLQQLRKDEKERESKQSEEHAAQLAAIREAHQDELLEQSKRHQDALQDLEAQYSSQLGAVVAKMNLARNTPAPSVAAVPPPATKAGGPDPSLHALIERLSNEVSAWSQRSKEGRGGRRPCSTQSVGCQTAEGGSVPSMTVSPASSTNNSPKRNLATLSNNNSNTPPRHHRLMGAPLPAPATDDDGVHSVETPTGRAQNGSRAAGPPIVAPLLVSSPAPHSPHGGRPDDWLVDSLERQLNLMESLLRQQRDCARTSLATKASLQPTTTTATAAVHSTNILTATFLTIREVLGSTRASEIMYEALVTAPKPVRSASSSSSTEGRVSSHHHHSNISSGGGEEEISTTETLVRCLCRRIRT